MATFSTTVSMNPETVEALKLQGYSLLGFKAVEGAGSGAAPTVWFQLEKEKLLTSTEIEWTETYTGYNSTSQIEPNTTILTSNTVSVDLGDLITIAQGSGNLTVSTDGTAGAVSFQNNDTQQYTVGISQMVNGQSNVLCAFPILGSGGARVIKPIVKIALIFATGTITTATVITQAMSAGVLIDLTGVESRQVEFSVEKGWSAAGSPSWLTPFAAFADLRSLLIESPSPAEKRLVERARAARAGSGR